MRRTRIGATLQLPMALLFVSFVCVGFANADEKHRVRIATCPQLSVEASQSLDCDSRWHTFKDLKCTAESNITLPIDVLTELGTKGEVAIGDEWNIPAETCAALAKTVAESLKFKSADEGRFGHWQGAEAPSTITGDGKLVANLTDATSENGVVQHHIQFRGELRWTDVGKTPSRFGPNSWSITTALPVSGELFIDAKTGTVNSLAISGEGTVNGKWDNGDPNFVEPFTGDALLKCELVVPLGAAEKLDIEQLVKLLHSMDETKRESAHRQLREVGARARPVLEAIVPTLKNPEVKIRLERLLRQLPSDNR